jgi:hypothetical protein
MMNFPDFLKILYIKTTVLIIAAFYNFYSLIFPLEDCIYILSEMKVKVNSVSS